MHYQMKALLSALHSTLHNFKCTAKNWTGQLPVSQYNYMYTHHTYRWNRLMAAEHAICSLLAVLIVCTSLHSPPPIWESALTLTSYWVSATSPVKLVDFGAGEPEKVTILQDVNPLLLYCTWYWEMANSLWGGVQVTLRVIPDSSDLVTETTLTLEGTVRGILEWGILFILLAEAPPHRGESSSNV